jgi:hypothetical protein
MEARWDKDENLSEKQTQSKRMGVGKYGLSGKALA